MNELDLFTAALSIQDSQARSAYLEEHCQGNAPLRQRLEELLKAYGQADQVLPDVPAIETNITELFIGQKPDHLIGTLIAGKYKLLEEIGEGGMGTVFVAEQTEPVKRKVAIKLIKPGMDSKNVLARFEAERQALAMMDHPNIAKVLDAGLTEERRPFFVMEYIKGLPLTKYCDDVKLPIDERLKLFIQICQAVQHAHQKGIIHRDLKPTNILIALYDGKPVPKVIDFGLAKALHHSLTERTLHTGHELVLGTPLYMSPEQAELNNLDIDTRSDIYSLGVILYELLTGVTPLEKQRFKEAAWAEVLRIIKEEEPSKPSTKLSHSASLPSVAAQRQIEPKKLSSLMKGDLDWIVMKALNKERERRYETANGFAADVNRYLSGESVTAVPPSAGYRLRKFVRRHKAKVVAASLVLLALLIGIVSTTFALIEARRHHQMAIVAQQESAERAEGERRAKQQAEDEAKKARKQAEQAEAVKEFLENDLIGQVDPNQAVSNHQPDVELKLKTALDRAVPLIAERFKDNPLVEASIRRTLGNAYQGRGLLVEAQVQLEKACELYRQELAQMKPGDLKDFVDGPIFEAHMDLAMLYHMMGQKPKALASIQLIEDLVHKAFGPGPEVIAISVPLTAIRDMLHGKEPTQAMKKIEEQYRNLGEKSPELARDIKEFEEIIQNSSQGTEALFAIEALIKQGKYEVAEKALSQLITSDTGRKSSYLGTYQLLLVDVYQRLGKYAQAESSLKQMIESQRVKGDHQQMHLSIATLAEVYRVQGKNHEALVNYQAARDGLKKVLGEDHTSLAACHRGLAQILLAEKKYVEAEAEIRTALNFYKKNSFGHQHGYFEATSILGSILAGQKKYDTAESLLLQGYEGLKQQDQSRVRSRSTSIPEALDRLIQLYTETNKPDEVKKWQAKKENLTTKGSSTGKP